MSTTIARFMRWPLSDLQQMANGQMNTLFQDAWLPPIDVTEEENQVLVSVELPGVKPDAVKITVENNLLTIKGERKGLAFERAFTLPNTIDAERISARSELGVLLITLPKAEKAKPRQISVQVEA
jgi:HSP20 family protein